MEIKQHTLKQPVNQNEITREIIKHFEMNESEKTLYQNVMDAVKAALRGKFMAVNTYIKKEERSQINNLSLHHKEKKNKLNSTVAEGRNELSGKFLKYTIEKQYNQQNQKLVLQKDQQNWQTSN